MKDKFVPHSPLTTPILFLIFNRPDTTQKVFNAIKQTKPKQLFIAADGPRRDKEDEKEKCEQVRKIIEQVDWDCEVNKNYSDVNLGCKIRPSSGIDWFFKNVEEGIILEDDCLPNQSFFWYCQELLKYYRDDTRIMTISEEGIILEDDCLPNQSFFWYCQELLKYYRDDTRIMTISGNNFQFEKIRGEGTYYFSKYVHLWGWATWRRAWKCFDVDIKSFDEFERENQIKNIFQIKQQQKAWSKVLRSVYEGRLDAWDYQWAYTCFINNGLCIMPNANLVSNIGFGIDSTHTKDGNSIFSKIEVKNITEIIHPKFILVDQEADLLTSKLCYRENIFTRINNEILSLVVIIFKKIRIYNLVKRIIGR